MTKLIFHTALIFFCCSGIRAQQNLQNEKFIDSLFSEYTKTPGVAVAVIQNGQVIFKKGYGIANLEYDIPITTQTVFHIASVSKQFTAFAIYLLEKQGKLALGDDVRKYIPELPVFGKPITIRHLLAHTSGLRDQWALLTLAGWQMEDIITTGQIIKLASQQKQLNFETGTQFGYSNTGYTLLAEIVKRVSGVSFSEFTYKNIFSPLGMVNTQFNEDFHLVVRNKAHSYEFVDGKYVERRLNYATAGATSLNTTVEDLAKWVSNFDDPIVGDRELIEKFSAVSLLDDGKPVIWAATPGDTVYHAKGQLHLYYKGVKRISHGGHDAAYRAVLLRFPDQKLAVITLSNNEHYTMLGKANPLAELYLGNSLQKNIAETSTNNATAPGNSVTTKSQRLSDFEGAYYSAELSTQYIIKVINEKLVMMHFRLGNIELTPKNENLFSGINSFGIEVRFIRKSEKVIGFEVSNFGVKNLKFTREKMAR